MGGLRLQRSPELQKSIHTKRSLHLQNRLRNQTRVHLIIFLLSSFQKKKKNGCMFWAAREQEGPTWSQPRDALRSTSVQSWAFSSRKILVFPSLLDFSSCVGWPSTYTQAMPKILFRQFSAVQVLRKQEWERNSIRCTAQIDWLPPKGLSARPVTQLSKKQNNDWLIEKSKNCQKEKGPCKKTRQENWRGW